MGEQARRIASGIAAERVPYSAAPRETIYIRAERPTFEWVLHIEACPDKKRRKKKARPVRAVARSERSALDEWGAHRTRRVTALMLVQEGRCYLCDHSFTHDDPPTRDHVRPRARGHGCSANILLAHASCNNEKADHTPTSAQIAYLVRVYSILRESGNRFSDEAAEDAA